LDRTNPNTAIGIRTRLKCRWTGLLAWWLGNLVRSGTKQPNPSTASAGGWARPLRFRFYSNIF